MKRVLLAMGMLAFLLTLLNMAELSENARRDIQKETDISMGMDERRLYVGSDGFLDKILAEEDKNTLTSALEIDENEVYSFLQGPRSWGEGIPWSGEWATFTVDGNPFGGFGCGLCCLANIYDTLSPYEVSPWDMCEYARTVTNYTPTGEAGAIGWDYMKKTLQSCGFTCGLFCKPQSYDQFRMQMKSTASAIVLISSGEDDTYWQNTPGHYVNIWLYNDYDETVFLAEPGNPENNRGRIPLRYIYDALKTVSSYQYLAVGGYWENMNQWKADGIDEVWNRPEGLQ